MVQIHVAAVTQRRNTPVVGFQTSTFAVPQLVTVRRHYRAVLSTAGLAGQQPHHAQQIRIPVDHEGADPSPQ